MKQITLAVPARDEDACIGHHLAALDRAAARTSADVAVLVFANGCTDATADEARAFEGRYLAVRVCEATLPPHEANAGMARRTAARIAFDLRPRTDILVTSDADSELAPDCLAALEAGIVSGADLVCGAIAFDLPYEVLVAPTMMRYDRVAVPYAALIRELRFGIDLLAERQTPGPTPHYTSSGACMALSRALYDRMGGLPAVPCGEDRALARCAEAGGARVRYCETARATVSPRLTGRAAGGMAETLRRRLSDPDPVCDTAFLRATEARKVWRLAHGTGRRVILPEKDRLLRLSDLERELPRLDAFVAEQVRPVIAQLSSIPPLVA